MHQALARVGAQRPAAPVARRRPATELRRSAHRRQFSPPHKSRMTLLDETALSATERAHLIGLTLLVGSLEFVGPFEEKGWKLAGTIVPIGHIAWSLWRMATGLVLLITQPRSDEQPVVGQPRCGPAG